MLAALILRTGKKNEMKLLLERRRRVFSRRGSWKDGPIIKGGVTLGGTKKRPPFVCQRKRRKGGGCTMFTFGERKARSGDMGERVKHSRRSSQTSSLGEEQGFYSYEKVPSRSRMGKGRKIKRNDKPCLQRRGKGGTRLQ